MCLRHFWYAGSCILQRAAPFGIQLVGTLSVSVFAFIFSFIVFGIIKAVMGVRVSTEEETEGLDLSEHGQDAYPDFANSSR